MQPPSAALNPTLPSSHSWLEQEVRDEYGPNRPVMLYALRPDAAAAAAAAGSPAAEAAAAAAAAADDPAELRRRRLNEGLSLSLLAPLCSTFTAVAPPAARAALPLLRWQAGSAFHASALCGAALDTASLPYRLTHGAGPRAAIGGCQGVVQGGGARVTWLLPAVAAPPAIPAMLSTLLSTLSPSAAPACLQALPPCRTCASC